MTAPLLIPRNRTPWETAVEQTSAERFPLPTDLVKAFWSPDKCPADLLGYLAEQMSVDVWEDAWSETKKREVCRNALKLHRLKATPAGIKAHVALTGATVKRIIRPPGKGHLRGAMTEEMRLAWLDTLPQVRIYPFATKATAKSRMFHNGRGARRQFHSNRPARTFTLGIGTPAGNALYGWNSEATGEGNPIRVGGFLRTSRARSLYGRRATFYDRGVETAVALSGVDGGVVEQVLLLSRMQRKEWHGRSFAGRGYLSSTDASRNIVSIRAIEDGQAFAVKRGVEPVDVRPQRISQRRTAPGALSFFGRFRGGRFLRSSHAPLLIYDRIALHDPDRIGARRKVLSWHGYGRFGIPPYTAEIRIHVPMLRKKRVSGRWHGVGHRKAADMSPLWKATESVRVSKAFRDTVKIDTATYGQVAFGGSLRFGDFDFFGEIREVR